MKETNYIADVAEIFHIPASTLRYWDEEGLIRFERSPDNNYRKTSIQTLADISEVILFRSLSIPLKEIRRIPTMGLEDLNHMLEKNESNLLQEIARRLLSMFLKSDVIGRIGGDEFVVFLSVKQSESFATERAKQIKRLMRNMEVKTCLLDITVSVGYSVYRKGDHYQSLFDRADQKLIAEKRDRKKSGFRKFTATEGIEMDVLRIQSELK